MRAMSLREWLRMPPSRSSPHWLRALLFALLVPLAQGVAASHSITHHGTPAPQRDGAPGALDATCVQCLLAAPVGAGALPSAPLAFAVPHAALAAPATPRFAQPASALALAYRSRAPPSRLH
jgi:hypothetical protein